MQIVSFSSFGYEGALVTVEVDLRRGIPAVDVVGLADGAVKESRERMRSAIRNSGFEFPMERVLISLSPADVKKEGAGFDLALALSVLHAARSRGSGGAKEEQGFPDAVLVMGELELSGAIRGVKGVHAAVSTAAQAGISYCIVSSANGSEAREVRGMKVCAAENLAQAYEALSKPELFTDRAADSSDFLPDGAQTIEGVLFPKEVPGEDFSDVSSQPQLIRALQVAAAGSHNLLAFGPPGCGKTLSLQRFGQLLPLLTPEEAYSVTRIHSLAGLLQPNQPLMRVPPFRQPHQTASIEGICGGGTGCRPGEISLAHNGVLFLDEAAEFRSAVLQMLRVPLETGSITLSRAGRSTVYPARFQLLMATNPCPCGNYGVSGKICLCSARAVEQYWRKFSGPLLDRIEIRIPVSSPDRNAAAAQIGLSNTATACAETTCADTAHADDTRTATTCAGTAHADDTRAGTAHASTDHTPPDSFRAAQPTAQLRVPIARAVAMQRKRQGKRNAHLTPHEILQWCALGKEEQAFLDDAVGRNEFSQRAIGACLKLARTIADMDCSEKIATKHLQEAIQLRSAGDLLFSFAG